MRVGSDQHKSVLALASMQSEHSIEVLADAQQSARSRLGARAIAQVIGKGEKATFAMLERGQLAGAQKVAGRWAFKPRIFFSMFETAA